MRTTRTIAILSAVGLLIAFVACEGADPRKVGEFCLDEEDCESGLCYDSKCLNPDEDYDSDGLKNGIEKNITGTDYGLADTDGDGVGDGVEVGTNPSASKDTDGDGINDALESLALAADPDKDCIPDQYDPANDTPDVDPATVAELHCSHAGVCGERFDLVTAGCNEGEVDCDYSGIETWEATEATCDAKDNNCDGVADDGLVDQECFNRNEYGKCPGLTVCTIYNGVMCDGLEPAAERCNEIDDNCNGLTDEGLVGVECENENDFGTCTGVTVCDLTTGGTLCNAAIPDVEICDSVDNDCDGETDEEFICDRTSTLKILVRGALLPEDSKKTLVGSDGNAPLAGATVNFYQDSCPQSETDETLPAWTGISGSDGVLLMPISPGAWCIEVIADGYQTMRSYSIEVPEQAYIPISLVMLLNGMPGPQLSLCGRVVETPDYAIEISASTEPATSDLVPVPNALVTLTAVATEAEIGSTKSDDNGYWCMYGLPALPEDAMVSLTAVKDLYYPTGYELTILANVVYFETLFMSPISGVEGECLFEGFEQTAEAAGWTVVSDVEQSSTWNMMTSGTCVAQGYAMECVLPFANESQPPSGDSHLCPDPENPANSCIPTGGSLVTAHAGEGFAWFGDLKTCSYAAPITACDDLMTRVTGSLVSPWIDGYNVWTLYMTFESAWEVESSSSETDIMYVEAQTSPMSESDSWSVVGLVKEMTPYQPTPVKRSTVGGGWTSGGSLSAPVWQFYRVDLSAFMGEFFRVRFRFDSVDGVTNYYRGWQIDDIAVRGYGCDQPAAM